MSWSAREQAPQEARDDDGQTPASGSGGADLALVAPDAGASAPSLHQRRTALLSRRAAGIAVAVAATVATATVLRVWGLTVLGFNSDEAVYAGQGAAIAGDPALSALFPVFRAHPLLFQMLVSLVYQVDVGDLAPRLIGVAFGLGTVAAGYGLGARVYGRRAGLLTAVLFALMPYLVVVNRQALLDGPMVFFSVLALWLMARFADEQDTRSLYAAAGALGLAFLAKETAVLLVPAVYAFLAVTPSIRVRLRDLALSLAAFAVVALPYPLSLWIAGRSTTGRNFLVWQLFRPPNHDWSFYLTEVPVAIGIPVVALAVLALVVAALWRSWSWRESLLVCWIVVPFFFFQLWPVKGFQYLLPLAPAVAVLAAGLLSGALGTAGAPARWPRLSRFARSSAVRTGAIVLTVVWLAVLSWTSIGTAGSTSFLAGTGGVPGGREAGLWVRDNTPAGAELLSIGPSMANILQFYGHRKVLGLSVSPNPLHRNPAYTPVGNPDLLLRSGEVQYLVWDAYSASRSGYFEERLMTYVRRYGGSAVHTESVPVDTGRGEVMRPVIVVYEVRP